MDEIWENTDQQEKNHKKKKRTRSLLIAFSIFSVLLIGTAGLIISHCLSDKETLREEGIQAFQRGEYENAEDLFQDSLRENQWFCEKMDRDTRLYLSSCYMRTGKFQEASDLYQKLMDEKYSSLTKDHLAERKELADALNACQSGKDLTRYQTELQKEADQGNTSMYLFLGTCYQLQNNEDQMISCYDQYLAAHPDGVTTYLAYQYSSYYLEKDDLDTASQWIQKGLSATDGLYLDLVQYNEIVLAEKQHDYETAYEKARSLSEAYPDNETYRKEYEFLDTRVNVNPDPVNTEGDASRGE